MLWYRSSCCVFRLSCQLTYKSDVQLLFQAAAACLPLISGALKLQNHIDKAYEKIVEDLRSAAECSVPQHQKKFLQILVESRT